MIISLDYYAVFFSTKSPKKSRLKKKTRFFQNNRDSMGNNCQASGQRVCNGKRFFFVIFNRHQSCLRAEEERKMSTRAAEEKNERF